MICLRDVYFSYMDGNCILNRVNLEISAGLTLLLGPNGCGKSSILKLMAGVERPDTGTVEIDGKDLWIHEAAARRNLAFMPEQPDLTPYAAVKDILTFVCRIRREPLIKGRKALEEVGLEHLSHRSLRELSMGQRRRVVLAAAWIGSPRTVLLDEPLESMDRTIRESILSWIESLLQQRAAVIIATHEIEPFIANAAQAVTFHAGICTLHSNFPIDSEKRLQLLEKLSRS